MRTAARLAALVSLAALALVPAKAAAVQDFPLPTGDAGLAKATQGPFYGNKGIVNWAGALWFTEEDANKLGRITTDGQIQEFEMPAQIGSPTNGPLALSAVRDDQIWMIADGAPLEGRVARYSPSSGFTYWNLGYTRVAAVAAHPAGGAWVTFRYGEGISYFDNDNVEQYFDAPRYSGPSPVTVTADGAAWFGDGSSTIKRITTSGDLKNFHASGSGEIVSMTTGPDGAVWYSKFSPGSLFGPRASGGVIGRMSADGSPRVFEPPRPDLLPSSLIAGPDGALWFTVGLGDGVGRMTTSGKFSYVSLPDGRSADSIAFGPDGALWYTDARLNRIGRMTQREFADATAVRRPVILSRSLKAQRKKFTKVKISCPAGPEICSGKITISAGGRVIAKGSYHMPIGRQKAGAARFNARGKKLLRKRRAVKVKGRTMAEYVSMPVSDAISSGRPTVSISPDATAFFN